MATIDQAKIDALKDGVNLALAKIEQAIALQVYAEKLPLIGAGLKNAFDQGEAWLKNVTAMKNAIVSALETIDTVAERLDTVVADTINAALQNSGFIGQSVSAVVNGGDVVLNFSASRFDSHSISLASDFGLEGLGIQTSGTATASLGYAIDLSVGIDSSGFYVSAGQANEIQASLTLSGADISALAELGFLNFSAEDLGSYFNGQFAIDLKDGDGKIRLDELDNDLLDATLQATSHIEVGLSADAGSRLLPSVSARLVVDWGFSAGTVVNPNDDNSGFGQAPVVKLQDVTLDLGSFMKDFVQPALQQLEPILKPINQVLAVLNSEVKVLKSMPDWQTNFDKTGDGRITFLDLVKLAKPSADLTPLTKFIALADQVLDWAEFLADADFGPDSYTVGDFTINGDVRDLNFRIGQASTTFGGFVDDLDMLIGGLQGGSWSGVSSGGQTGKAMFETIVSGGDFSVPILTDPSQIIKLLLGGNADLLQLDLPEVDFAFSNPQMLSFSIFPGINVALGGGVGLGFDLGFGYDTRGLLQTGSAIDGFYIIDGAGPEVTFSASITLGVALDAFIASLYGGGDITGTVEFDLADGIGSVPGRIYVDEMAALLAGNPFSIFDTSGRITAGFTAYATVFWGEVWRHTSPRVTLGSFSFDNPSTSDATVPPPPLDLGEKSGSDLIVNIGDRASLRAIADKTDGAESIEIGAGSGGVSIFGFGKQQTFSGITRVIASGGLMNDQIVMGDDVNGVRAEFSGGAGEDVLVGGGIGDRLDGGSERDYLEGNGGDDELLGGAGDDIIVGGAGGDYIDGGADNDIASYFNSGAAVVINLQTGVNTAGDAAGDTIVNVEIVEGSRHDDTITGGGAAHTLAGLGGNDTLTGTDGNDVLIGNDGDDILDGRGGQDILIGGLGDDIYYVDDLGDQVQENRMQEIAANANGGSDLIYAGIDYTLDVADRQDIENLTLTGAARTGTGNALANILTGTGGDDTLNGLGGADELHGGAGADRLNGGDQADRLYGEAGDDTLDGGSGADDMHGGGDDDLYLVDNAGDVIGEEEDEGLDTVRTSVNYVLTAGAHVEILATSNDDGTTSLDMTGNENSQLLRGDRGNNTLEGRGGADIFVGGDGIDTVTYRSAATGVTLYRSLLSQSGGDAEGDIIGLDIEILEGSGHDDVFFGTAGADRFRGLAGNDTFYGEGGDDIMAGGSGDDTYHVDSLSDVVDESDGSGRDRIVSSIDYSLAGNGAIEDLTLTGSARIGTGNWQSNRIEGTDGDDILDGGQSGDTLVGRDGDDQYWFDSAGDVVEELAGEGNDTIHLVTANFIPPTQENPDPLITFSLSAAWALAVENVTVEDDVRRIDITGNGLDNVIIGNDRNNTLSGLDGDDRLDIGNGRDIAHGGSGSDTLVLDWSTIGDGMEVFDLTKGADGYSGSIFRTYYGDYHLLNRVDFTGIDHFDLTLGSGGDIIRTGDGNDRVIGNAGSDDISTGAGVDIVDGGDEADGSTGADRWRADKSAATLAMTIDLTAASSTYVIGDLTGSVTRIETLTLTTGSGNDRIVTRGDFLHDVITTNGGDDTVKIAGGRDTVTMGDGVDTLVLDWSNIGDSMEVFEFAKGADGYSGNISRTYYGDYHLLNRVDFSGVDRFDLTLGSGNDIIRTGDGDDRVSGGAGNDWMQTGGGADIVDGGSGVDRWLADRSGITHDLSVDLTDPDEVVHYTLDGRAGSFTGIEMLTFTSGSGNDTIITRGEFYEDVISTSGGDDLIKISGGRDTVNGGSGSDTLVVDWSTIGDGMEVFEFAKGVDGYSGNISRTYYGDYHLLNRVDFTGIDHFDLTLGSGGDIIRAGDGNDRVIGNAGNDDISTGAGVDIVDGGDDIDRWRADKSAATLAMTIDLTAASSTYVIGDLTGSVTRIETLTLTTGSGNDRIVTRGDFLHDVITTNGGDDTVKIAGGRDTVAMGTGIDTLVLDWSGIAESMEVFDLAKGTDGYSGSIFRTYHGDHYSLNRLDFSGVEKFDLTLGSGGDIIRTGDGNDRVIGNAGNDDINTGAGVDIVDGGNETDGSAGADRWRADKSAATLAMTIDLTAASSTYVIGGMTGSVTRIETLTLTTGSGNDRIVTRSDFLHDVIVTNSGDDTVKIAGGRDTVTMGNGIDTLVLDWSGIAESMEVFDLAKNGEGYSGSIFRTYHGDHYSLNRVDFSGVDRFDLTLGSGGDIIRTGDGNDRVIGNAGNDDINTGTGVDIVDGGNDIDRWRADKSAATLAMTIDLTAASSTYAIGGVTGSVTRIETLTLTTGSGNDRIVTRGDFLHDVITTNSGDDTVKIAGGRDTVTMGTGIDTLVLDWSGIGDSMEVFDLAKGTDGYSGNISRTYYGDHYSLNRVDFSGVDRFDLTLGSGNDIIRTGDGNDRVIGNAGNDDISTGAGVDIVDGGNETDGSAGADRWRADKSAATLAMTIDLTAASSTYVIGGVTGSVTRIEALTLTTGSGNDRIVTRNAFLEDVLTTGDGDDTVKIAGGRDTVTMGNGIDTLVLDWSGIGESMEVNSLVKGTDGYSGNIYRSYYGDYHQFNRVDFAGVDRFDITMGSGNDIIRTGDGNDRISGGVGDDWLTGGGGADTFVFTSGKDTVTDFQLGADKLTGSAFAAIRSFAELLALVDKTDLVNTVIRLSADNVLTLQGVAWQNLTGESFVNNAPVITSSGGATAVAVSIAENTAGLIGTITATDAEGQPISYALSGVDAGLFSIDAAGRLAFKAAPNFENPADNGRNNVYNVTVNAIDGFGASDSQSFAITVTNQSEAPVITSNGGGATASIAMLENTTAVTTVTARDDDAGSVLRYSLSGTDAKFFSIDTVTGKLAFKVAPDFEKPLDSGLNNTYDLIVTVRDEKGLTDTQAMAVKVTNQSEAPVITSNGGGATASIAMFENTTAVTTVTARDDDAGSVLRYSLSGVDAGLFAIDAVTGKLAFKVAPNFEKPLDSGLNNTYDLVVTVRDEKGLTDTQALTVKVTNQSEAPVITSNGGGATASIAIFENTTAVTTVTARDDDAGSVLRYSLSGTDAKFFAIDTVTGKLAFKVAPDFEKPLDSGLNNTYDLIVTARDEKGLTDTQALAVKVADVKGIVFAGTPGNDVKSGTVEADTLKGAGGIDRLSGLGGDDMLDGGIGNDFLNGGDGRDTFIFSTALGSGNVDTLQSFNVADDTIQLNKAIFTTITGTKALSADQFVANVEGVAKDSNDHIVYDTSDGKLYYDANGSAPGGAVLFAVLDTRPALTALDFTLI